MRWWSILTVIMATAVLSGTSAPAFAIVTINTRIAAVASAGKALTDRIKSYSCVDEKAYKRISDEVGSYEQRVHDFIDGLGGSSGEYIFVSWSLHATLADVEDAFRNLKVCPPGTTYSAPPPAKPVNRATPVQTSWIGPEPTTPAFNGGGFFVQGYVGGAYSVPSLPTVSGIGSSGGTFGGAFGYRTPFGNGASWGSISVGLESHPHDETFAPPLDDLKVHVPILGYVAGNIGPNFALPNGMTFAPFVTAGLAVAEVKVTDNAGSASHATGGFVVGAGFDLKLTESWYFDVAWQQDYLSTKTYTTGGFNLQVKDQPSALKVGLIYKFNGY
jgi:opacity protein-like surface antigen